MRNLAAEIGSALLDEHPAFTVFGGPFADRSDKLCGLYGGERGLAPRGFNRLGSARSDALARFLLHHGRFGDRRRRR
jgi:hypothetical protein